MLYNIDFTTFLRYLNKQKIKMMKKLFITAMLAVSMFATANAKNETPSFFVDGCKFEMKYDSTCFLTMEKVESVSCVKFYDINRIVIENINGNRVIITDSNNRVWADTTKSVDMLLPCNNYTVYSQTNVRSIYRGY